MSKKRINREKDLEAGTIKFTVIESGQELTCKISDLPESLINAALVHAINAKVGDSAADPKLNAFEAMEATWTQLKSGEWNARSGGEGSGRTTVLAQAVANVTGKELDEVVTMLSEKTDEEKKELRAHAQVNAEIKSIQSKNAADKAKAAQKAAKDSDALTL